MNRMFRRPGQCYVADPANDPPANDPPGGGNPPPNDPPANDPPSHFAQNFSDGTLREHPAIRKFETPESLGRAYLELEKKIGSKGLVLPGENATPEEVRRAFTELGCPEAGPDGYDLGDYKPPENFEVDEDFVGKLKELCWNNGVPNEMFRRLYQGWIETEKQLTDSAQHEQQKAAEETQSKLQQLWGTAKQEKLDRAKLAAQQIWGDDAAIIQFTDLGDGTALGNNPGALQILAQLGELMVEHDLVKGLPPRVGRTTEEAREELRRLQGDSDFQKKLHNRAEMGHEDAKRQWEQLNEQAYPTSEQTGTHGSLAGRGVA